ncbi:MAG: CheY-P phosphatase CheC [Pelotomaculum sp. PtaU1.Bin035]|nr:MAG: CheY-P phosphatase CheC [Pelotomaculum sp. PtaU1.Bin035]
MLSSLQQHVLKEFLNVSIGQATYSLSEMANQKIQLTIPEIELTNIPSLSKKLKDGSFSKMFTGHIVSSSLAFGNEFNGKAKLVFPVNKGKILVNFFVGEEVSPENGYDQDNFSDTDIDALKEIGNIILNTIVGGFANLLDKQIIYSLPEVDFSYYPGQEPELIFDVGHNILLIHTTFSLVKAKVEGAIFIILTMESISNLIGKINEMLVCVYE